MLHIKTILIDLWHKAIKGSTPQMQKAVRLIKRHRIVTTVVCGLLTLSMLMSVLLFLSRR